MIGQLSQWMGSLTLSRYPSPHFSTCEAVIELMAACSLSTPALNGSPLALPLPQLSRVVWRAPFPPLAVVINATSAERQVIMKLSGNMVKVLELIITNSMGKGLS